MLPRPQIVPVPRGVTLIELLLVVVIISVLTTLSFPLFGYFRDKARDVSCIANLRVLYTGASSHLLEHDMVWPQMPPEVDISGSEEPMWEWWFHALEPYSVAKHHWLCASETVSHEEKHSTTSDFHSTYIPTDFEATPNVAYRWKQPWFMERGQFHGKDHGPNVVMPDGTVKQGPSLFER